MVSCLGRDFWRNFWSYIFFNRRLLNAITNFLCGVKFIMGEAFNSGDLVIIDGTQQALIIKVGLYETIFQTQHDGQTLWRHVPNSRLDFMNISRVIQSINEDE